MEASFRAASAALAAPFDRDCAALVLDGRGERHSHLAARFHGDGSIEQLYSQDLPHSLGLLYEDATDHLGFLRSSDEFKVMALASYGVPRHAEYLRQFVHATGDDVAATDGGHEHGDDHGIVALSGTGKSACNTA